MSTGGLVLVALAIAVGLAGIVVPVLPGSILVIGAIAVWAFVVDTTEAWVVFGVAAALIAASQIIKYTWPVKRMRRADVRTSVLVVGGVAGVVGFFVVPVIGLLIGFVLGVFAAELAIRQDVTRAWVSTLHAVKGVALSVGVELTGAVLATVAWAVGVFVA
ncbi:DUF456 domain-containing protein [Mycobacterium sp. ITM-2016-00317]|uniref:DUF456 domain-containing protein n=1 Tax=Mycobacterium sp. ITM-2016-00317 TaxID=2099694 RepID=UPI00287FC7AD|nr:DUF456 domain-containing protein [Mycobacterium sp. ITM-2016-00317]WNG87861.1 DUF456 domain-containing protein [Mycobacterium sp. ITM-2016-00317]